MWYKRAMSEPEIRTSSVTMPVADGSSMAGYLATPAAGKPRGALIVIQEIFGVNAHVRDATRAATTTRAPHARRGH